MKNQSPELEKIIDESTGLKQLIVNYVGTRLLAEEEVTVDMAVQVFSAEFPEFLMAIAEENFLRGYEQALIDIENTLAPKVKSPLSSEETIAED